jgi:2-(1,2-epoxy-1,2-dihydrophenyl)acetyl-CoA isomerase
MTQSDLPAVDGLHYAAEGLIATLTLDRPASRNALGNPGDGDWFAAVAARINADPALRCVVLQATGPAFSAGGDLKAMRDRTGTFAGQPADLVESYRQGIHRLMRAVWSIEVPVIAAVNGPAMGLGNDVACLADLRLAAASARFGATFLKIGLVPGDGGAWLLPRVIGQARAAELLYTGRVIDADTALAWGLVSAVVPDAELPARARALADEVAAQPPGVLRMTKRLLRAGLTSDFTTVMELSAALQAVAHTTADHAEALAAVFAKRPPEFTGR